MPVDYLDFVEIARIARHLDTIGDTADACLRWTGSVTDPALRANCTWTPMDRPSCGNAWCVNARHWRKQVNLLPEQASQLAGKLQQVVVADLSDTHSCWLTTQKQLWFQRGLHSVRDLMWRWITGVSLPAYARVRTSCGNRDCVNPHHALAGQALDYGSLDVDTLAREVGEPRAIVTPVKPEKKNRKFR